MHWVQRGHKKRLCSVESLLAPRALLCALKKNEIFCLFYNKQQIWFSISLLLMHLTTFLVPVFLLYSMVIKNLWSMQRCPSWTDWVTHCQRPRHALFRTETWERSTDLKCGSALVTSSGCQAKIRLCFAAFSKQCAAPQTTIEQANAASATQQPPWWTLRCEGPFCHVYATGVSCRPWQWPRLRKKAIFYSSWANPVEEREPFPRKF